MIAAVWTTLNLSNICRYITQEGNKLEVTKAKVPTTVTNAVSWRSEGIKYKKNEVFIDVIESINVLVSVEVPQQNVMYVYAATESALKLWRLGIHLLNI